MSGAAEPDGGGAADPGDDERAHFCPWCGTPVGSFFGRFGADGATWCDRCDAWFRAVRCDDLEDERGE